MTNKAPFCTSLRLIRTVLSFLKTSMISVNPVILSISSSCPSCASWLQNPFNPRNPLLINDLRLRKSSYEKIQLFLQNEPNFRKSQMNLSNYMTMNYVQMYTWSIRKNEPKTNPNEPKTNPILANKATIRTQTNPKRTQFRPNFEGRKPQFSLVGGKVNFQTQNIDGPVQIGKISDNVCFAHKGLYFERYMP